MKHDDCTYSINNQETPLNKLLPQRHQDMLKAVNECMAQSNDINNKIIDREIKTLHLPLKAQWYEMIEIGEKKEEYREIKDYWLKRLFEFINIDFTHYEQMPKECVKIFSDNVKALKKSIAIGGVKAKDYTHVKFSYGYTKRTMTFEIEAITIGKGKPEWGAPYEDVFIIKLGKRV